MPRSANSGAQRRLGIAPNRPPAGESNGHASAVTTSVIATSRPQRRSSIPLAKPILDADASATLRDQLLGEIAALGSIEQIDDWALRGLTAKNTLHAADALLIEVAFRRKLTELSLCLSVKVKPLSRKSPSPSEVTPQNATAAVPDRPPQLPDFEHSLSRPNRADCATSTIANLSRPSPVLCAGASPPTPIICASHNPGRSAAKLATNLRCRSAACIIARSIALSKNSCGGRDWASIQCLSQTNFGLKLIPAPRSPAHKFKLAPQRPIHCGTMTSLKQIEANRRNAQSSTGPRTEAGKQRSSRNAVRHGLTAETVIEPLEDAEDYEAFEEAMAASFDPETAVERELILRLASLLWRLRRATSIETALFQTKWSMTAARNPCPNFPLASNSRGRHSRCASLYPAPR